MVLRVKLEIVPYGVEEEAREIGRLDIFNMGLVDMNAPEYKYGVINLTKGNIGLHDYTVTHIRKDGAWALVKKVLSMRYLDEGP